MAIAPTKYNIRQGDTLSALAKRFNTTVDALAKANNIKNVDVILTGGTLVIPGKRDDFGRFNRPSLGSFSAAAGRKSGRYKDLAARLRERESAARSSSMESMPVALENAVSNTGSHPTSDNLINPNDPTLRKLANAKLGTGAEHSCVKTTRDNMVRAGVVKPFSTGNDVGNNPRGAMVQLGQQGWKSVPFPGSQPLTVKSPYGTMQANVLPRDQYLKLMKEGKIPEGAVVFSTRHASWNGTSDGSRGYDMALVRNHGLYNYKQVGASMYHDLKSVVVMVPSSALSSGGGAQKKPTTTPAPVAPPTTGAGAPQGQLLKDAQKLVDDVRAGKLGEVVSDVGQLLRDIGTNGLPDGMPVYKPAQLQGGRVGGVGERAPKTATGSNAILNELQTNGASAGTAHQAGKGTAAGVGASRKLANLDLKELQKYKAGIEAAAKKYNLPPAVIAAIISRESHAGKALDANGLGDNGHGYGLMQIDRFSNGPGFKVRGGPFSNENIDQGAEMLRKKLDQVKVDHPGWSAPQQLKAAIAAYNTSYERHLKHLKSPDAVDAHTTGHDYSSDVWARAQELAKSF